MSARRSAPDPVSSRSGIRRPPATRSWRERIDDPDEPLYTMAIAADLLRVDVQGLRRMAASVDHDSSRPSGNQRRYSRRDLELLGRALELSDEGHNSFGIARILELESRVDRLTSQVAEADRSAPAP